MFWNVNKRIFVVFIFLIFLNRQTKSTSQQMCDVVGNGFYEIISLREETTVMQRVQGVLSSLRDKKC